VSRYCCELFSLKKIYTSVSSISTCESSLRNGSNLPCKAASCRGVLSAQESNKAETCGYLNEDVLYTLLLFLCKLIIMYIYIQTKQISTPKRTLHPKMKFCYHYLKFFKIKQTQLTSSVCFSMLWKSKVTSIFTNSLVTNILQNIFCV